MRADELAHLFAHTYELAHVSTLSFVREEKCANVCASEKCAIKYPHLSQIFPHLSHSRWVHTLFLCEQKSVEISVRTDERNYLLCEQIRALIFLCEHIFIWWAHQISGPDENRYVWPNMIHHTNGPTSNIMNNKLGFLFSEIWPNYELSSLFWWEIIMWDLR